MKLWSSLSSVAIACANITKEYGQLKALDGVSFEVKKGEIFGFIGPNGAGKTTTIRILTTLFPPSSGQAKVLGYDIRKDSDEIRCRIGYVQQQPSTEFFMTVKENLDMYGRLWGVEKKERRKRAKSLAEKFGLNEILNKGAIELSIGERRRLQVAREFMHDMKLLFFGRTFHGIRPNC